MLSEFIDNLTLKIWLLDDNENQQLNLKGYNIKVINMRSEEPAVSVRMGSTVLVLAVAKSFSLIWVRSVMWLPKITKILDCIQ